MRRIRGHFSVDARGGHREKKIVKLCGLLRLSGEKLQGLTSIVNMD
jgi:hypothetical protein